MPSCLAFGCSNTSGRCDGKQLFVIPRPLNEREKQRASQWLHNIGTGFTVSSFKFISSKTVCEDHFHVDCFKEDLRAKLMGSKPKKILIPGAIPTIFKHNNYEMINIDGTRAFASSGRVLSQRKRKLEVERKEVCNLCSISVGGDKLHQCFLIIYNYHYYSYFYCKQSVCLLFYYLFEIVFLESNMKTGVCR